MDGPRTRALVAMALTKQPERREYARRRELEEWRAWGRRIQAYARECRPLPSPLTRRQRQVVTLLARGLGVGEIALRLGIQKSTVRSHRHALYAKLGVHNCAQAVLTACERGWL
jgi:DNA-binding NarL/FixJ family response regulator